MLYFVRSFFTLRPRRQANVARSVNIIQAFGLLFAQLLDYSTTVVGLKLGAIEQNVAMATIINTYGQDTFLYIKLAASALLIWFAWSRPVAAWFLSLIYFAVALWNLSVIYSILQVATITLP